MKRYSRAFNPTLLKREGIKKVIMNEDKEGVWVKYEDVKRLVSSLIKVYGGFEAPDDEIDFLLGEEE